MCHQRDPGSSVSRRPAPERTERPKAHEVEFAALWLSGAAATSRSGWPPTRASLATTSWSSQRSSAALTGPMSAWICWQWTRRAPSPSSSSSATTVGEDVHWQAIKYASYLRRFGGGLHRPCLANYVAGPEDEAAERLSRNILARRNLTGLNLRPAHHSRQSSVRPRSHLRCPCGSTTKCRKTSLISCVTLTPFRGSQRRVSPLRPSKCHHPRTHSIS